MPSQTVAAGTTVSLSGRATDPEDGGLSGAALQWMVDDNAAGSGPDTSVAGLTPGTHLAKLTATDGTGNSASATAGFEVAPLGIPLSTTTPTLDGSCDDAPYSVGQSVSLKPYSDGAQATVRILRTTDHLWACFSGMKKGAELPGAFAGLRVDVDHSRNALAQGDDYGFFIGEDGDVVTEAGDGAGSYTAPGPGGLVGQLRAETNNWSAELRIDRETLGGWDHRIGLVAGHYRLNAAGDDYIWPYSSDDNRPAGWATSVLGNQPLLTALDPFTKTVGSAPFTLNVEGSGFVSGATVLWNGTDLNTTFVDENQLTAQLGTAQLSVAGIIEVKARTPSGFESNGLTFVVEALAPVVNTLSPATVMAGSPTTTITVNGDHFAPDAQVLWNGVPLATQFVNAAQVKTQVSAALLADGQTAGAAVRNQSPSQRISNAAPFEVMPQLTEPGTRIYLPVVMR